jgi:hypothetical protein
MRFEPVTPRKRPDTAWQVIRLLNIWSPAQVVNKTDFSKHGRCLGSSGV